MTWSFRADFALGWLALLLLAFTWISTNGIARYHDDVDHAMVRQIAGGTTLGEVFMFSQAETHPPLGYIAWHFWLKLAHDPVAIRSLALVFGGALILQAFLIGNHLGGRFAGLCTAALVAFSPCIIAQSFVVRSYTLLLLLLFMQFYFWLRWRDSSRNSFLYAYMLCGAAAVLVHFSALFAVFIIAAYQIVSLYRVQRFSKACWRWIIVNLAIGFIGAYAYYLWLPTISSYAAEMADSHNQPPVYFAVGSLFFLPETFMFLLPAPMLGFIACILVPVVGSKKQPALTHLMWLAIATGIALFATNRYPFLNMRHALWIAPFILPLAGVALAEAAKSLIVFAPTRMRETLFTLSALCLLAAAYPIGLARPQRIPLETEYNFTGATWKNLARYISALPSGSLLVSGKLDALLLSPPDANIYRALLEANKQNDYIALSKHVLFSKASWVNDAASLKALARELEKPEYADVQTLFIFKSRANYSRNQSLMCDALEKKLHYFPPQDVSATPVSHFLIIEISKQEFLNNLIAADGKAHGCLK